MLPSHQKTQTRCVRGRCKPCVGHSWKKWPQNPIIGVKQSTSITPNALWAAPWSQPGTWSTGNSTHTEQGEGWGILGRNEEMPCYCSKRDPFRCSHLHLLKGHWRNTSCREGIERVENDRNLGSSSRPGMPELMEIWGTVRRKSTALIKPSCVTYTPLEFLWDGLCALLSITWLQCKFPHTFIWEGKKVSAALWAGLIELDCSAQCLGGFWLIVLDLLLCLFLLSQLLHLELWEFQPF